MLFNPVNLPYWIFLGIGVLLFLLVIISGGGDDDLDVDTDIDADVDDSGINFNADTDADSDSSLGQLLGWLGIGKAPLILLLATDFSLWGVWGWMLNVVFGVIISGVPTGFFGSFVLLSSLLLSLFGGRLIARPLGKIFAEFGEDTSSDRLIGCFGNVSSAFIPRENQGRIAQVDVLDPTRNLVTINATLPEWATIVPRRGDKVLVINQQADIYSVIAKDSRDQDYWLENKNS